MDYADMKMEEFRIAIWDGYIQNSINKNTYSTGIVNAIDSPLKKYV
jgi:hypothetical protein